MTSVFCSGVFLNGNERQFITSICYNNIYEYTFQITKNKIVFELDCDMKDSKQIFLIRRQQIHVYKIVELNLLRFKYLRKER